MFFCKTILSNFSSRSSSYFALLSGSNSSPLSVDSDSSSAGSLIIKKINNFYSIFYISKKYQYLNKFEFNVKTWS